jgi:site-specific recombinase XerD
VASAYAGRTSRGLRAQTRLEYQRDLEWHALAFFGRTRLTEIGPRDIKRFIATQIEQGLSSSSVRRRLAPLLWGALTRFPLQNRWAESN